MPVSMPLPMLNLNPKTPPLCKMSPMFMLHHKRLRLVPLYRPKINPITVCLGEASEGVGVGQLLSALDDGRGDGGAGMLGKFLVGSEGLGGVALLVDDAGHAILAVVAVGLGAVVPDGLGVIDDDQERQMLEPRIV